MPTRKNVKANVEPLVAKVPQFYADKTRFAMYSMACSIQVYNVLNDGLIAIGLGLNPAEEIAADVQKAFETWKASAK